MTRATILVLLTLLGACSSQQSGLQTRESFTSQGTENGQLSFSFTLFWYLPAPKNDRLYVSWLSAIYRDDPAVVSGPDIDGKTRLELESLAVLRLKSHIQSNRLCATAHQIEDTKWHDRAVTLSGSCQAQGDPG